jgi:hypothetical protein
MVDLTGVAVVLERVLALEVDRDCGASFGSVDEEMFGSDRQR